MADLSTLAIFFIYLLYGAVFFAIGIAVTSRRKLFENLKIAGIFWLLAAFALTHAAHEWLEMFRLLELSNSYQQATHIRHISLFFSFISFFLLLLFGTTLMVSLAPQRRYLAFFVPAVTLTSFILVLLIRHPWNAEDLLHIVEYDMRLLIAFPSSLLTAIGFCYYWHTLRTGKIRGAWYFLGTGCGFACYALFTGLIPSGTSLFLPVEIWRGLSAFVILTFLMSALDTFMVQREEMITEHLQLAANSEKFSAIGRLAAGIAHEINNPLTNASLQLELLRNQVATDFRPSKYCKKLDIIEKSIDRSSRIAKELLVFAGGSALAAEMALINLDRVIQSAWQLSACRTQDHYLRSLTVDVTLRANALKLEELFLNLFINAIDAMPAGGTIAISARNVGDKIVVEICDEGSGIAVENQDHVMEPFFTTKESGQGTGLGLAICYGIMELHGGTISIGPRTDHQGTCVTLTFPTPADTNDTISGGSNETDSGR